MATTAFGLFLHRPCPAGGDCCNVPRVHSQPGYPRDPTPVRLRPVSSRNEILVTLNRPRPALRSVTLLTVVINLLMLAPSLYMLQIYDRMLGSDNHMTLLMLALMVLGLCLLPDILEWMRSLVVIRLGGQLDMQFGQRIYDTLLRVSLERGE